MPKLVCAASTLCPTNRVICSAMPKENNMFSFFYKVLPSSHLRGVSDALLCFQIILSSSHLSKDPEGHICR